MIERVNLQIHAALDGISNARLTATLARPDRGTAAIVRQLADIDAVLRGALQDLSSDSSQDDLTGGSEVERRALLKLTGAIAGASLTPLGSLEQIADALDRPGKIDAALLDAHAQVTTTYAEAFYQLPPAQLAGPVRAQLDRLVGLARHPTVPQLRARLEAMIGDTAAFAGTLAYDLDQPGSARAHLALAADAAKQAGATTLRALVTAMHALVQKQVAQGDPRASALLDNAYANLPDDAPAHARSWLAVHYANDCAATGDELGHHAAIEVACSAAETLQEPLSTGFLSDGGWYLAQADPYWLDENRARGLAALGHSSAEPLLIGVVDGAIDSRMRANALNSLAGLYTAQNEIHEACHAALRALEVASDNQLPSVVHKVRTTRSQLQDHHRARAVRELDAALATA